jgi:predicted dehydrogenase
MVREARSAPSAPMLHHAPMTRRPRVALIGPGTIGRRHLAVLRDEPDVELVAVVGRRPATAATAAAAFGGRPYDDPERMLDAERPDAAWLCVPPDSHGALEAMLLERGVHLFVEKPLAVDRDTPERIAAQLDASGVIAAVGYHWRAMDTMPGVEDVLASRPARLVAGHWHDTLPAVAWWRDEARGGGQIVEQATHLVDLSRRLAGEAVVVTASEARSDHPEHPTMTVADTSTATLRYDAGALGVFTATCILSAPAARELRLVSDGLEVTIREDGVAYGGGVVPDRFVPVRNDPFRAEDRAFLDAVRTSDASGLFSTYRDALRTHRLTCAIREAAARPAPSD